ncbi:spore coat protein T-like [Cryptotermes secundus]|uniref:spore coat protein T-like n=1 Tax=Cryptotermes secundus TaxID=105785 RepID=UPI000CD7CE5C|nr:spore coat protein T-like [Cryptotermes secundus]
MDSEMKRKQVASALMLVAYFTTYTPVTSESITESALQTALSSRSPLAESDKQRLAAYPSHEEVQYTQNPEIYPPYYQYQYPPNPYYGYPNSRYFYPPNGYQNGIGGYPQSVLNRYPNYPLYGYQLPNGYPYRTGYQYPNVYYPYQYRR